METNFNYLDLKYNFILLILIIMILGFFDPGMYENKLTLN